MTNSIKISARIIAGAALSLAAVVPAFAFAASYAYVDQAGDVRTVEAANANTAIATAPNIDEHSGVMLLVNPSDAVIGDHVQGV
ncbi:MAG TPA: hypothetical protein VHD55_03140 [Candidatus Paceibacterota bacterium]|nr:hypothetical protein [Candidatus Paceibacterota bacterium]